MNRADRVLDAIYGALDDGTVSVDAMHWTPKRPALAVRPTPPEAFALSLRAVQPVEEYDRALRQLREAFAPVVEAATRLVEEFGRAAAEAGLRFGGLSDTLAESSPPRWLRDEDPKAYALAARRARGTGPDRQIQNQRRPRRHAL